MGWMNEIERRRHSTNHTACFTFFRHRNTAEIYMREFRFGNIAQSKWKWNHTHTLWVSDSFCTHSFFLSERESFYDEIPKTQHHSTRFPKKESIVVVCGGCETRDKVFGVCVCSPQSTKIEKKVVLWSGDLPLWSIVHIVNECEKKLYDVDDDGCLEDVDDGVWCSSK